MKLQLPHHFLLAGAVTVLISQPAFAQVVEVTSVELNSPQNGIEIILETPAGKQLQVLPRIDENTYIADIPNTQLRLPSVNTFRQENPTEGIASTDAIIGGLPSTSKICLITITLKLSRMVEPQVTTPVNLLL